MSDLIYQQIGFMTQMHRRWMTGNNSPVPLEQLPDEWQSIIESQTFDRRELCILSLCSQFQTLMYVPEIKTPLIAKKDLPDLQLPVIPETLQSLFRRILQSIKKIPGTDEIHLLRFLLQRGYTAHPADWLPSSNDKLPAIYHPWLLWATDSLKKERLTIDDELNADTWDLFYPAERLSSLRAMRLRDAAAARNLIEQCFKREAAEIRYKIIETLSVNLYSDDCEFLQRLTSDRSQKIARLSGNFLARLGYFQKSETSSELQSQAEDLAAGFEVKKSGFLKKKFTLVPVALKSNKQMAVRSELLEKVPFIEFASALKITGDELSSYWRFSENRDQDNRNFLHNAVNTASDNHISLLLKNALNHLDTSDTMVQLIMILFPRLNETDRTALHNELIYNSSTVVTFSECMVFFDEPITEMSWNALTATRAWKQLKEQLSGISAGNSCIENSFAKSELFALGLLIPSVLAEKVIDTIVDMGIIRSDPALDTLKFNSQLSLFTNKG